MAQDRSRGLVVALVTMTVTAALLAVALAYTLGRQSATEAGQTTSSPKPDPTSASRTPSAVSSARLQEITARARFEQIDTEGGIAAYEYCGITFTLPASEEMRTSTCPAGFTAAVGGVTGGAAEDYWLNGGPWTPDEARAEREAAWQSYSASPAGLSKSQFDRAFAAGLEWVNREWAEEPWRRP